MIRSYGRLISIGLIDKWKYNPKGWLNPSPISIYWHIFYVRKSSINITSNEVINLWIALLFFGYSYNNLWFFVDIGWCQIGSDISIAIQPKMIAYFNVHLWSILYLFVYSLFECILVIFHCFLTQPLKSYTNSIHLNHNFQSTGNVSFPIKCTVAAKELKLRR